MKPRLFPCATQLLPLAVLLCVLVPLSASAITYLPGQTLDPACLPTDSTCIVSGLPIATGSVLFGNGTAVAATSSSLFWDNVNNFFGIGTSTPSSLLSIAATSAQNAGASGVELTNAGSWTSTGWTGSQGSGFTHTTGNTSVLTDVLTITPGDTYVLTFTVTGRTTGTCSLALGGVGFNLCTTNVSRTLTITALNSSNLTFTPSSTYNGTISNISVKQLLPAAPAVTLFDSTGAPTLQLFAPQASLFDTFVGLNAGASTTGAGNSAFGVDALQNNLTGTHNSAFGYLALASSTTASNSTAFGYGALASATTSNPNTAVGSQALLNDTTGFDNDAFGELALFSNTTGINNLALGDGALFLATSSSNNIALGVFAQQNSLSGSNNILIGSSINLASSTASNQLDIGNTIFGTSLYNVGGAHGSIGINTSSPIDELHIPGFGSPVMASSTSSGLSTPNSVFVSGRYAYVSNAGNNSLVVFDVSNPASPVEVGSTTSGLNNPHSVYVSGRYAYVASFGNNSLVVLDVSNPASPTLVGSTTNGLNQANSVYVSGRYAYVGSPGNTSLVIFDISNPASPLNVGSTTSGLSNPVSVSVSGRYAYVASSNASLLVFDVSNPASPVEVGSTSTGLGIPQSLYVSGRYAYVADGVTRALVVFDVSNPASPTEVGSLFESNPESVYVSGRYAYVTDPSNNSLVVLDVSNPASPTQVGSISSGLNAPNSVYIQGRYAYVTDNGNNSLITFQIGGEYTQSLEAGTLQAGSLQLDNNLQALDGAFSGGLTVGNNLNVGGSFSLTASTWNATTTAGKNYSIFSLNTASSSVPIMTALYNGRIAIGTSTPSSRLTIWGTDTASTSAFSVVNSASTTVFASYDNGNATYSGLIFQSSDQRLKTNIDSLDSSSSLALVNQLNPVSYTRIDQPQEGTTLGFLAQDVQKLFPSLVSTSSPTSLTPDGTLTLNYQGLIAPLVKAVQGLSAQLSALQSTVAGFADSFTTRELVAKNIITDTIQFQTASGQKLCLGSTCVTEPQLQAMLAAANQTSAPASDAPTSSGTPSTSTPPTISVSGNNPAHVQVGTAYSDLGATITGPEQDLNLDIRTSVNGTPSEPVSIDTSNPGTSTIDYVVTDTNGLTATSTRTVVVFAPVPPVPSSDATTSEQ